MLNQFKKKIEKRVGNIIHMADLQRAIESATKDKVNNCLVLGGDVSAEEFEETVAECIKIHYSARLTRP